MQDHLQLNAGSVQQLGGKSLEQVKKDIESLGIWLYWLIV